MINHKIFIKVVCTNESDDTNKNISLSLLQYVYDNLHMLKRIGVSVRIYKIYDADIQNEKITTALAARGIESLPALITPKGVYIGYSAIKNLYDKNIKDFLSSGSKMSKQQIAGETENGEEIDLQDYYDKEMKIDEGDDQDEQEFGEGNADLSSRVHAMVQRREDKRPKNPGETKTKPKKEDKPSSSPIDSFAEKPVITNLEDDDDEDAFSKDDLMAKAWADSNLDD